MTSLHRCTTRAARLVVLTSLCLASATPAPARAAVVCSASDLCPPGTTPCTIAGTNDVGDACHLDFSTRAVTLTGTLQAQTTGSSFSIAAGSLTLSGGKLRSPGTPIDSGGDIDVTVADLFRMEGTGPRVDTGAPAGAGAITITAGTVQLTSGTVIANGGGTSDCGDGGSITIDATGNVTIDSTIDATAGAACGGGSIEISGAAIDVRATINASGGDGGLASIELDATNGDITTQTAAPLRVNGSPVSIDTGGDGGSISLSASGAVILNDVLETTGASVDGSGGSIEIEAGGNVIANEILNTDGLGAYSFGGSVSIDAGGRVDLMKDVRARGGQFSSGGTVDIEAKKDVNRFAGGSILADGGSLGSGFIDIRSRSKSLLLGGLRAKGLGGGEGGVISVDGCSVDLRATIDVGSSSGALPGAIVLRGSSVAVTATGAMLAPGCAPGIACNEIDVRSGTPALDPAATIDPAPAVAVEPALNFCCGNSTIDSGETCDDGNDLSCDGCSRTCTVESTPACPPDGNACTQDCSPTEGCVYVPLTGSACESDGNACNKDVCHAGTCTHPPKNCNDGIFCTVDSCDPATGCQSIPTDSRCGDGTTCTTDTCDPTAGCLHQAEPDGSPCSDSNICTTGDHCQSGACMTTGTLDCDDGDDCTSDSCIGFLGCVNADDPAACPCAVGGDPLPAGTRCADGNGCTAGEECDGNGLCVGGEFACDDGDPCTTDSCQSQLFCTHTDDVCSSACSGQPDGTLCSDGDTCTDGSCQNGVCQSTAVSCDDGDPCNGSEACFGTLGCRKLSYSDRACSQSLRTFVCYRDRMSRGSAPFLPVRNLEFEDVHGETHMDTKRVRELCLPADVDGSDPAAPADPDLLESYLTRDSSGAPLVESMKGLQVTTVYGTVFLDMGSADRLWVPTAMSKVSPPALPVPPDPDAMRCYRAQLSGDAPMPPAATAVPITDAFGSLVLDLRMPTRLCFPGDLNGQNPGAADHPQRLACFQARITKGHPAFARELGLYTRNLFGAERIDASRLSDLCLPATVVAPSP